MLNLLQSGLRWQFSFIGKMMGRGKEQRLIPAQRGLWDATLIMSVSSLSTLEFKYLALWGCLILTDRLGLGDYLLYIFTQPVQSHVLGRWRRKLSSTQIQEVFSQFGLTHRAVCKEALKEE